MLLLLLLGWTAHFITLHAQSRLVYVNDEGRLAYRPYTEQGDVIPDFSYCGYRQGGVSIPEVKVAVTIEAPSGTEDDTPMIQAAIDSVAKRLPDREGFRGCVLLKRGTYRIARPIRIHTDGIVLRGEGQGDDGTVLLATSPRKYTVIEVGNRNVRPRPASERYAITDRYVPSGSRVIHVDNAEKRFKAGDDVIVRRPSTAQWIHETGMDSIAPRPRKGETTREAFLRFRREGAKADMNGTKQWKPGSRDLLFERKITKVEGDEITLDVPLVNALQAEFGGGSVYKYTYEGRIARCGVERLSGKSLFDRSVKGRHEALRSRENPTGEYFADESHADIFVDMTAVENAWIRNVSATHFDCCAQLSAGCKYVTGQDLEAREPVSRITGGRRYAYHIRGGQLCLFQRCRGDRHRHQFVVGSGVAGPNAFVDGEGETNLASSEPHHRWSAGCLWDNITLTGHRSSLMAANRGCMGSGHGWAGAQMVFWNCAAPLVLVMQPPTAQNFAIGLRRDRIDDGPLTAKGRKATFNSIVNASMATDMAYRNEPMNGTGWTESPDKPVSPGSLYYRQLLDRLGTEAVRNVMTSKQIARLLPAETLPAVIESGPQDKFHVQGVAVDLKRGFVCFSFTTTLIKTDLKGNLIGSVKGLTGHLGCLTLCPDDGRVYGSLEYKNDAIGKGILREMGGMKNDSRRSGFYIAIFDPDKITRPDMDAERDGVMTTVYLPTVTEDYYAAGKTADGHDTPHRYGCSGIDGVAFAPSPGERNGRRKLYVAYGVYADTARMDNDYQTILAYDIKDWKRYERPLSQADIHTSGPERPEERYFAYTGNTTYGVQNLAYDPDSGYLLCAVYKGVKRNFPNYTLFAVDLNRKPRREPLKGFTDGAEGLVLPLAEEGKRDERSGVRGWRFAWGATGLCPVGGEWFYISHPDKGTDGRQSSTLRLYRWTGDDDAPFTPGP